MNSHSKPEKESRKRNRIHYEKQQIIAIKAHYKNESYSKGRNRKQSGMTKIPLEKEYTEIDNIHNTLSLLSTLAQPAKPAVFQLF